MTVSEALAAARALTGTAVDGATLCRWLSELDGRLAAEVLHADAPAPYLPTDGARELLLPAPWDGGVYTHHLEALSYYTAGEYLRAENARVLSEAVLLDWRKHRRRETMPEQGGSLRN